jgi:hypothetical protein
MQSNKAYKLPGLKIRHVPKIPIFTTSLLTNVKPPLGAMYQSESNRITHPTNINKRNDPQYAGKLNNKTSWMACRQ